MPAVVEGEDPLAPFSPTAATHLLRTDGFADVADITVGSFYDPALTREDMGRPTRAEADRDAREADTTPAPPCNCGVCLRCAVRRSRG